MYSYRLKHYKEIAPKLEKEIEYLKDIVYSPHLSKIIEVRQEAQRIFNDYPDVKKDHEKIAKLLEPLAAKEKELFKKAKLYQEKSTEYLHTIVELESELSEVNLEIMRLTDRSAAS